MSEKRRLVYSVIQFLQEEIKGDELSEDAKESLEVGGPLFSAIYRVGQCSKL